ncbi:50S ribosomal protein L10 [Hippea maritima]|uniref:Large ribosomal subunit protein uL10 n=1 Tax=Hippea maritima (strain ATCC 700847 / DSM 10411 / MH2) TaxID=760142 RepID=F2LXV1_HIPMA|nr:50S ribosomal protein L10 [Hippea maritima]AEA34342.1 50S ribosomal protein L10 [Hippea maritima DSM 10411]
MKKERKVELAKRLAEQLQEAKIVIVAGYSGLTVAEMENIRNEIKKAGCTFNVIKNNIVKKAIEGTPWDAMKEQLKGANAFALGFDDPAALAKLLVDKSKEFKKLEVKFGFLGGKLLSAEDIKALSSLPPKEVLLAQVLGTMKAPISGFVNVLAANIRQLLYALKAIEEKKKEN